MEKKDNNKEDKFIEIKIEEATNDNSSKNTLKEFEFILNRSKNINKIVEIDNPVKKIEYSYTREENYSDEILYYLTQLTDKINQTKYNLSLNSTNYNSNFHIYDLNYTTEIDIFYQYELFKNDIHNNSKSYNVHEHRKVPFENEIKNGKRRIYQNFEEKNNYFKKINANRRSETYDKYYKKPIKNNSLTDNDKNEDKVLLGEIKEFKDNNIENEDSDSDISMDIAIEKKKKRYKKRKRKEYCEGLTTYDPFHKKKKKSYKEDNYDK